MPRIILQNENLNLSTNKNSQLTTGFISDRDVLKKRSKKYLKKNANTQKMTRYSISEGCFKYFFIFLLFKSDILIDSFVEC